MMTAERLAPPTTTGNPREYDTGSEYQRLSRLTRILAAYAVLITIAFLIEAVMIWTLFPLKTIVPQFVYFSDKTEQIVTVEPGQVSRDTADLIVEKQLRQVVQFRETINCIDESDRYAWLQRVSDADSFQAFRKMMDPQNNTESPIKSYCQNDMAREVYISSVYPNSYADNIWTVDFITTDRKVDQVIGRKERVATVAFKIGKLSTNPTHAAENPIGMTVIGYQARNRAAETPTETPVPEQTQ
jgi:type IV secretory pathway component VirB8